MSKSFLLLKVEEDVKRFNELGFTEDQIVEFIVANHETFVKSLVKYALNNLEYCGVK